jgi:hypothetical protein
LPVPAHGPNGVVRKPDGSSLTQITHFKDSSADGANWAPGGQRIVFDRHWHPEGGPNERLVIYTANFDGTGQREAAKAGNAAIGPNVLAVEPALT